MIVQALKFDKKLLKIEKIEFWSHKGVFTISVQICKHTFVGPKFNLFYFQEFLSNLSPCTITISGFYSNFRKKLKRMLYFVFFPQNNLNFDPFFFSRNFTKLRNWS